MRRWCVAGATHQALCCTRGAFGHKRMAVFDRAQALISRSHQAGEVLVIVFDMYFGVVKNHLALKERDLMCDGFLFQIHVVVVGDSKA